MNQVSRTSHFAFRRHVVGMHVDLDDRFVCAVEPEPDPTLQGVNEVRVHVVPVPTRLFAERLDGADVLAADAATRRFRPSTGTAALSASATSGRIVEPTRRRPP